MKLKHFAAGFVFLASFTLSVLLAGIPARECTSHYITPIQKQTVRQTDTELQARIRIFLENDRQTGRELSRNLAYFRDRSDELTAEVIATGILVREMHGVDCLNLPDDFCSAWEAHYQAWSKKDKFLRQYNLAEKLKFDEDLRKDNSKLTGEINRTYDKMLKVAEKYGVYFNY